MKEPIEIQTESTEPQPREAYEEPLLLRHEPLLEITGQKSGEKPAAAEKAMGPQGGVNGGGAGNEGTG